MTTTDRRQGLRTGLGLKAPCVVASTAALALSGEQTIDGIAVGSAQRVLVKDQSDLKENGIYDVGATAWARSRDFDGDGDAIPGTAVYVDRGTAGGGKFYAVNSSATSTSIVITTFVSSDADDKEWSLLSVALAGVSAFSQNTLLPLATAAAWRSSDGLNVRSATALIASTDIANQAVSSTKIADSAIISTHFAINSLPLTVLSTGTAGTAIAHSSTGQLAEIGVGTTGQVLTSNGAGLPPTMQDASRVTIGTVTGTTASTAITVTVPSSDTKFLAVTLKDVSMTGGAVVGFRLGSSDGTESDGYSGRILRFGAGAFNNAAVSTEVFHLSDNLAAGDSLSGTVIATLHDPINNVWMIKSDCDEASGGEAYKTSGQKSLATVLDRFELSSTTAFDGGSVNYLAIG